MSNINAKKRLMYLSGEDFYFYCYSLVVILDHLGCKNGKYFRDHRKLAFLIDIISDEKVVYIITHTKDQKMNAKDHERLLDSYSNGLTRRSEILKLLFVLEKRQYVSLERGKSQEINVTLKKESLPKEFFESDVFEAEKHCIKQLSKSVGRLASLTLDTMLDKIYVKNGVRTWA